VEPPGYVFIFSGLIGISYLTLTGGLPSIQVDRSNRPRSKAGFSASEMGTGTDPNFGDTAPAPLDTATVVTFLVLLAGVRAGSSDCAVGESGKCHFMAARHIVTPHKKTFFILPRK